MVHTRNLDAAMADGAAARENDGYMRRMMM